MNLTEKEAERAVHAGAARLVGHNQSMKECIQKTARPLSHGTEINFDVNICLDGPSFRRAEGVRAEGVRGFAPSSLDVKGFKGGLVSVLPSS